MILYCFSIFGGHLVLNAFYVSPILVLKRFMFLIRNINNNKTFFSKFAALDAQR